MQYFCNVTLVIKNALQVDDLNSHKLEFLAENPHDITIHVVDVEADDKSGKFLFKIIVTL